MANQLIRVWQNPDFYNSTFRKKPRSISACRKVISKVCDTMFRNSGFEQLEVQKTWSAGSRGRTLMCLGDCLEFSAKQISVLEKSEEFISRHVENKIRANGNEFKCSPMQTTHFRNICKIVQHWLFSCKDDNVIWNKSESSASFTPSFVGYVRLFSDKTATNLTSSAFVAYPIKAVLLNVSPEKSEWLIYNGYKIVGFLPVSTSNFKYTTTRSLILAFIKTLTFNFYHWKKRLVTSTSERR